MSKGTLDHDTLQAVGVLVRAVEQTRVPGVLEFRLLTNALNRVLESRGERELHEAERVFRSLDRDFRARIVERANEMARAQVGAQVGASAPREAKQAPPPVRSVMLPSLGKAARSATGFLSALNGSRASASKPPDSRGAAKSRLMEAVERQREAANDILPNDLLPGAPLPRSAWTP